MEHIAPLIQTFLWVGLIVGVLWRFHAPIYGLLAALQKRVEAGSDVKAGPFELTQRFAPQDPAKQKEKAATELQEVLQATQKLEVPPAHPLTPEQAATVQAKYFQAEDLVLRAIQAEYGATVSRQVTAGADMGFDGVFVTSGRLNVVEVKYVTSAVGPVQISRFRSSVERLSSAISRYGWRNAQVILAVVFENSEDLVRGGERLQKLAVASSVPLVIRSYSIAELQLKFGVAAQEGG